MSYMSQTTKSELAQAIHILKAAADAIREAGSIPSGHLYAAMMGKVGMQAYNQMIALMVRSGLVELSDNHMLTWKGPQS